MIIRRDQLNELTSQILEKYITHTIDSLKVIFPEWFQKKGETEARTFIKTIVAFAKKNKVVKSANVSLMIRGFVEFNIAFPIPEPAIAALKQTARSEKFRAEQFYLSLQSGRPFLQVVDLGF